MIVRIMTKYNNNSGDKDDGENKGENESEN